MTSLSSTERQCICRIRGDPIVQDCDGQILTLSQVGFFEVASFVGSDTCPSFRVSYVTYTKRWRHSCNMLFSFAFSRSWRLKMWEVIWSSRPTSSSLSTKWWRWKLKAILTSEWVKHNVTMSRHLTLCPGNYNNIFSVIRWMEQWLRCRSTTEWERRSQWTVKPRYFSLQNLLETTSCKFFYF